MSCVNLEGSPIAGDPKDGWVGDVLKFWFEQTEPDQWFKKDLAFDGSIRERFLGLHEVLVSCMVAPAATNPALRPINLTTEIPLCTLRASVWAASMTRRDSSIAVR